VSVASLAKPLVAAVMGERQPRPPIWIMRQAGRYLPEYRELRTKVDTFLDLCYSPALAAEVTMQPLRRFDLDAAILFSDILVIPDALGQKVTFLEGEGPRLEPVTVGQIKTFKPERVVGHLGVVLETLSRVEAALSPEKALIGFCGSPWTVATYMIGGKGSPDQAAAKSFAWREPEAFAHLLEVLVEASAAYLIAQLKGGADVVQLFESWAGNLDDQAFIRWVIEPNRKIVEKVRAAVPGAPIIGFPRGAGAMFQDFAGLTGISMVGLDTAIPARRADDVLPAGFGVQGNLDPLRLIAGGVQMEERVAEIIGALKDRPHVFNLGHGILPETPIAHVSRLVEIVKGGR
jgi:uroporphyrinogen decarboxylase